MVGWSSLLDYLFLPMINVLLAKIYLGLVPRSAAVGVGSDLCRYSDRREPEKR